MTRFGFIRSQWGFILVTLSAVGFAAKGIFAKIAYREGSDPSTVLTLRMLCVLPVYLFGIYWFGRKNRETRPRWGTPDFRTMVLMGLLGFDVSAVLDFEGLARISAGMERLILFLYPTFVVFLSAYSQRKPLGTREIGASVLAYAGIAFVTAGSRSTGGVSPAGFALVLGSALFYALYLVGMEGLLKRTNPLWLTSVVMSIATGAISLQTFLTGSLHFGRIDSRAFAMILLMGLFSTLLPTFFMSVGISLIGASRAAVISFLGPVMTLFLAMVFLGEKLTFLEGIGTIVVLGGVALITLWKEPRPGVQKEVQKKEQCAEEMAE
jgi:drug/metabolite transporter (DMT)-like permease